MLGRITKPTDKAVIQTLGGSFFSPFKPDVHSIDLEDIAHSIANLCRFTGHTPKFYSVAEHSVKAAWLAFEKYGDYKGSLAALMHDAAEAYLGDLSRPVKKEIIIFQNLEREVLKAIDKKFDLSLFIPGSERIIKDVDDSMLATEAYFFKGEDLDLEFWGSWVVEKRVRGKKYRPQYWSPKKAKRMFLREFKKLKTRLEE